jgi:hypothetical protein
MRNALRTLVGIGCLVAIVVAGAASTWAQTTLDDFDQALAAIPLSSHVRILTAIEYGLSTPGFPAADLLQLIHRLAAIPGTGDEKESILMLLTRAIESGQSIGGLLPVGFDLANALEEGLPIEGVVLEALKGIAQGVPITSIASGVSQRLTLLREVRDLLFEREIFRQTPGSPSSAPTILAAESFDQLVVQIADAVSDYVGGGGSPFEGNELYGLVTDRLTRLAPSVVPSADVALVLDRIGPPDLTRIALAALR